MLPDPDYSEEHSDELQILLLGVPVVLYQKQILHIQRRQLRALLYFLACQDNLVSRSELLLLFWPDDSEEDARRHLREVLSKLRAAMPDPTFIIAEQDRVGINHKRVFVDVLEFQRLVQISGITSGRQVTTKNTDLQTQSMLKAIALWHSTQFMTGATYSDNHDYERWLVNTGQSLEFGRQLLLETLADQASEMGELDQAIHWARMALETDNLNEMLHLKVISCLKELGRQNEAINYISYVRDLYRQELNSDPPVILLNFFNKFRQLTQRTKEEMRPSWSAQVGFQVPFVGRKSELEIANQCLNQGDILVIYGESGAGKSRLVQEVYQSASDAPRLLLAKPHALEINIPYHPLVDLLRNEVLPTEWARLDPIWMAQLTVLIPELAIIRSDSLPAPTQSQSEGRALLLESLHQLLKVLAQTQRILFYLDDAQWADEATLRTLGYLLDRNFFPEHGLLVIASRVEEINPALENILAGRRIKTIELELLNNKEVEEISRYVLGKHPSPELVNRLTQDTGGNPLFLLETLQGLMEFPFDLENFQKSQHYPITSSLRSLVRERLRRLPVKARSVLVTAAVIGSYFSLNVLEEAAQMDPEQLVRGIEDLEKAHLIRPLPNLLPGGGYNFIHDQIMEVMNLDLSQARKRLLHLRVARALEKIYARDLRPQAAVIARHYEAAGESLSAFHSWLTAGQYARQMFSQNEAYTIFQRAEKILQQGESLIPDQEVYELYKAWGMLALEVTDFVTMQRCYTTLLHLGEKRRSDLMVGSAYSGLAETFGMTNLAEKGLVEIEKAIPILEKIDNRVELLEAYNRRGLISIQLNRFRETVINYEKFLGQIQGDEERRIFEAKVDIENNLAFTLILMGWPEKGRNYAQKALQDSLRMTNMVQATTARLMLSLANGHLCHYETALDNARLGFELAENQQNQRTISYLHIAAAQAKLGLGQADLAWDHTLQALALAERYDFPEIASEAYCLQGDALRFLQDYERASEYYRRGASIGAENFHTIDNSFHLGFMLGMSGKMDEGMNLLEKAIVYGERYELGLITIRAKMSKASVLLKKRQIEEALQLADELSIEGQERRLELVALHALNISGQAAVMQVQGATATKFAQKLIGYAKDMHNPWLEIEGLKSFLTIQPGDVQAATRLSRLLAEIGEHTHFECLFDSYKKFHAVAIMKLH